MATYQLIKTVGNAFGSSVSPVGGKRATDGYAEPLSLDSNNSLFVNVSNSSLAVTQSGAWTVSGSGTFTVAGTVTANIGTTNGLALDTTVSGLHVAQGSTTSGQTGALIQGAVTTAAPSYSTGKTSPLSLTTSGLLRVDGSGVTQPVSGTVTANAGSGTFTVSGTVAATQSGSWNVGQSGTWTVQPGNTANTTPWLTTISQGGNSATVSAGGALKVDGSAVTQPVSGTVTANQGGSWTVAATQSGSWNVTASGTITANIGTTNGLALDTTVAGLQVSQASSTSGQSGHLIQGAVKTAAPSYSDGYTNPLSLTTAGALRVDASATTQPVSGTVTANAGSGTFTVDGTVTANAGTGTFAISAASLPLPSGAATSAKQPALGTAGTASADVISIQGISGMTAVKVDGSAVTQPVSGTIAATQSGNWTIQPLTNSSVVKAQLQDNAGNALNSTSNALNVSVQNSSLAVTQSGSWSVSGSGNFSVVGTASDNTTNSTAKLPVLGAKANSSAPTWTDGYMVPLSVDTAGALRVGGTVTANAGSGTFAISAASLPLPSGAATSAKQPALGTSGTASADVITVQGISGMTALKVDGTGFTQTISGTVAVSNSFALDSTLTGGTQKTKLVDSGGTNVATVSSGGALKVDGSAVTQPVSGTITANAGSGNFSVVGTGTDNTTNVTTKLATLPAKANTSAPSWTDGYMVPLSVDTSGNLRVSGSFSASTTASTSGGADGYRILSAANTTTLTVKASAGQVYMLSMTNTNASARFVKLYNSTSATVGTTTPFMTFMVPGNANGAGQVLNIPVGLYFSTGIQVGITTGVADNDVGAPSANEVLVNIAYK